MKFVRARRWAKWLTFAIAVASIALVAAGCASTHSSQSDTTACVYSGKKSEGQALKHQIPPGSSWSGDDQDEVVQIPTSNRFYMAAKDSGIRDPGAPEFYDATASGGVQIQVQGQLRFRFNVANACQWYANHGRRNQPLDFNGRNLGGWAKWLNENFGFTMTQVVPSVSTAYDWASLVYHYPTNADPTTGLIANGGKSAGDTVDKFATDVGTAFTAKLNQGLGKGGPFFCGIEDTTTCGPIEFQVLRVTTENQALMNDRQKTEELKQQRANATGAAKIVEANQSNLLDAEKKKQALLTEQLQTALLQAEVDNAKCIALARHHLDCEGHFQTVVVGGTTGK